MKIGGNPFTFGFPCTLGFEPVVRFDGPVDTAVDDDLANELFAVIREALSNVAKHAGASAVQAWVEVRDGMLLARIVDNGAGAPATSTAGRGLDNMGSRANRLGGTFSITFADSGTELLWSASLANS